MLCKSWATSCEFLVMKVLVKLTRFSNFLFSNLAVLYAGACRLFITGQIGSPSLCVFIYAFRFGALGFIFIRYFSLSLSISKLHVWRTCCVRLWKVSVGSFFNSVIWFCCMKLFIFCSRTSVCIVAIVLLLSALTIVRLFLSKMSLT